MDYKLGEGEEENHERVVNNISPLYLLSTLYNFNVLLSPLF